MFGPRTAGNPDRNSTRFREPSHAGGFGFGRKEPPYHEKRRKTTNMEAPNRPSQSGSASEI